MGLLSTYLFLVVNNSWLWMFLMVVLVYWLYMRMWIAFYDTSVERTDSKTFIITGAESGIGKMTVDLLAARGGRIIMACKDVALGNTAREQIVGRTKNQLVEVQHLDLSSLESVRKFSAYVHETVDRLDALVNNASISCASTATTADGLNTVMQVNHFGPFLLTNLLLDLLKKSAPSRIVFVSSVTHHFHKFSLDNINCDKYDLPNCRVYFNSKLANILTAKHFARMLQGTGVTSNSLHPGMTEPDPASENSCSGSVLGMLCTTWKNIFGKTFREGAMTSTYVATEPKLTYITGQHFSECKTSGCVARIATNTILQEKLFEKSAQLVKLKPEERHV